MRRLKRRRKERRIRGRGKREGDTKNITFYEAYYEGKETHIYVMNDIGF